MNKIMSFFPEMNEGKAAFLAALIAAFASVTVLVAQLVSSLRSENRGLFRNQLEPLITVLGASMYEILACSKMILFPGTNEKLNNWRKKAAKAKGDLSSVRHQLRYPLWGLDEGLRVLTRFPNWVDHCRNDGKRAQKLITSGTWLRRSIDFAVRRCYKFGRPPTIYERLFVQGCAYYCRLTFETGNSNQKN